MKVLFVFNHPAPYKVSLFNELAKHIDLMVCFERLSNKDRNKTFYDNEITFNHTYLKGIHFGNENSISSGVIKLIKKNNYDLIIMNGYHTFTEMKTISYLKKHHIPYALYINGGIVNKNELTFKKAIKTKYISGANYYFSPDKRSDEYLEYYGANKENIFHYPYSTIYENEIVNHPVSQEEKNKLKRDLDLPYDKIAISCGQFINRKNYMFLIKQWETVNKNYHLILIGDGPLENEYKKYIKKRTISNIHIINYKKREELFKYFRCSNIFVFPSKEDIYAHVINEAMSQGLPVLSSNNVNAALHLIKDGYNGYIFDLNSDNDFKHKLFKVMDESSLSNNAIITAKENTIEEMVSRHLHIFEKIRGIK